MVGVHKSDVRQELKYLATTKVLTVDGESISLNKDYDQWRISLVKAATNSKRFEDILARNLRDSQVGKIPTEVGKTPTKTELENIDGWQNTNLEVGKIPTEGPPEANGDTGSQPPKESIKEIKIYPNTNNNARARETNLYQQFQAEFGRPLSPTEIGQIQNWDKEMPLELITEALKRAVLGGKFSFKYIDRILLEWQKNNVQTLLDVKRQDEQFQASKGSNKPRAPNRRDGPQKEEDDQKEFYKTLYMG
ncbi:MAG: DnaD domain protein [Firmicutes bacterium]|nr:DnaD domain protein [Bacillota bacterium]